MSVDLARDEPQPALFALVRGPCANHCHCHVVRALAQGWHAPPLLMWCRDVSFAFADDVGKDSFIGQSGSHRRLYQWQNRRECLENVRSSMVAHVLLDKLPCKVTVHRNP